MELYIPPEPRTRNFKGQFLKGHNECRGKKKKFSEEGKKRIIENLKKATATKGRKGTNNGRKVIGISTDGSIICYPSANFAERANNLTHGVISQRCSGKTKNRIIGGKEWYWESDERWINLVK